MNIKHIEKGGRGAFLVKGENGDRLAELTYVTAGETGFTIDHTQVDESLRGQGVGEKLIDEAVKYARDKGLKISATCPYASRKLADDPKYSDVYSA